MDTINDTNENDKKHEWKAEALVTGCLLICGIIGFACREKIKTFFGMKRDNNKAENQIKVNHAKSEDSRATCQMKHQQAMERDAQKHEQKLELIDKREEIRKNREMAASGNLECTLSEEDVKAITLPSAKEICERSNVEPRDLQLGASFLHIGIPLGIVGPTDIGKSTFALELAAALARGDNATSLDPEWIQRPPMPVIYFAMEHTESHLQATHANEISDLTNLKIICGTFNTHEIIACIEKMAADYPGQAFVIFLDNGSKCESVNKKEFRRLCNFVEQFRGKNAKEGISITPVTIYHTNSEYRMWEPLYDRHVAGSQYNIKLTQEFIGITKCNLDPNARIVKVLKQKIGEKPTKVFAYTFDRDSEQHYKFFDMVDEKDVLLKRNEILKEGIDDIELPDVIRGAAGRPSMFAAMSDEAIQEILDCSEFCTNSEIKQTFGIKFDSLLKYIKQHPERKFHIPPRKNNGRNPPEMA